MLDKLQDEPSCIEITAIKKYFIFDVGKIILIEFFVVTIDRSFVFSWRTLSSIQSTYILLPHIWGNYQVNP